MSKVAAFSESQGRDIIAATRYVMRNKRRIDQSRREKNFPPAYGTGITWFIVTGSQAYGTNRYKYSGVQGWRKVSDGTWAARTGGITTNGFTDPIYNPIEAMNNGGTTDNHGTQVGTVGGATIAVKPIAEGTPIACVRVGNDDGTSSWEIFNLPPPLEVTCS